MQLDADLLDLHRKVQALTEKHDAGKLVQASAVNLCRLILFRLVQERHRRTKEG